MDRLSLMTKIEEATDVLTKRPIGSAHRWCVVLDCAGSSRAVTIKLVGQLQTLIPQGCISRLCLLAGPGLPAAGVFCDELGKKFPTGTVCDTKVIHGGKSEYVVTCLIGDTDEDVVQTCEVNRYRCGPQDHATATCTRDDCPGKQGGEAANPGLSPRIIPQALHWRSS